MEEENGEWTEIEQRSEITFRCDFFVGGGRTLSFFVVAVYVLLGSARCPHKHH